MPLYTYVSHYLDDRLYLDQYRATSVEKSVAAWWVDMAPRVEAEGDVLEPIDLNLPEDTPTPMRGVTNVWVISVLTVEDVVIAEIVETVE